MDAEQKCQATKLAAFGRYTQCRINAEATFVKNGDAIKRQEKVAKCSEDFAHALSKADEKYGAACPSSPPTAALDSFLAQCADNATSTAGGACHPSAVTAS